MQISIADLGVAPGRRRSQTQRDVPISRLQIIASSVVGRMWLPRQNRRENSAVSSTLPVDAIVYWRAIHTVQA